MKQWNFLEEKSLPDANLTVSGRGRGDTYVRLHIKDSAAPTFEFLNAGSCAYARAKKWIDKRRVLEDGRTKARASLERAIELLKLSK